MQETKLTDAEAHKRAEDAVKKLGWQAKVKPANGTDKGSASAGVGVLAKKHVGMRFDTVEIQKKFQSRLAHSWLRLGRRGGLCVFSVIFGLLKAFRIATESSWKKWNE